MAGRLDAVLAAMLLVLALGLHWEHGEVWTALIDAAACLAAALVPRWPLAASAALGIILGSLIFTPDAWGGALAEHAALIPILGTGIRGQREFRLRLVVAYGVILSAITIRNLSSSSVPVILIALSLNATLVAVLWIIGDLFSSYRFVQERLRTAALREQRVELARELHDTVARSLSRASLHAQTVTAHQHLSEIEAVVSEIQQASSQLRWMLALLRDPVCDDLGIVDATSARAVMKQAEKYLAERGFRVATTIEGDLADIPLEITPTLRCVVEEACANIERHADPGHPCIIMLSAGAERMDALFLNTVRVQQPVRDAPGVGLTGMNERLALVGGNLNAGREGTQWITQISIPTSNRRSPS